MSQIKIKDIDMKNLENLEGLCIPDELSDDPMFVEGNQLWKKWMRKNLEKYGSIGKIAYMDSEIVGAIQYIPKIEQKVVEIKCNFAREDRRDQGTREALLKETIEEFERSKIYFEGEKAKALITYPFHGPRKDLRKRDFYLKNGFKQVSEDEDLLYYPLIDGYEIFVEGEDIPIKNEDKDKAMIFCNSSCPYSIKEMNEALEELRRLDDEIPIKIIVPFEETEELSHIFSMPVCLVIKEKIIGYSFLDKEKFSEEVKKALPLRELLVESKSERNSTTGRMCEKEIFQD